MSFGARTVLITGASSGLGLEFVKQIVSLDKGPEIVIATCRCPEKAEELRSFEKLNPNTNVKILKLNIEDDDDLEIAFQETKAAVQDLGLNLLINNAAVYDRSDSGGIRLQTREKMQHHFNVNATSPILVTQKFLPLLQQAAVQSSSKPMSCSKAGIVMMSSRVGSQNIAFNDGPGASLSLHYKCSKSALNMATIMIARELKENGILVFALHPGWVKTKMGTDRAPMTPSESIKSCLQLISTAREDIHGRLVTMDGEVLPY